jgi:hypothetical protein
MFSNIRIVLLNRSLELNSPQNSDMHGNLTEHMAELEGNNFLKGAGCEIRAVDY